MWKTIEANQICEGSMRLREFVVLCSVLGAVISLTLPICSRLRAPAPVHDASDLTIMLLYADVSAVLQFIGNFITLGLTQPRTLARGAPCGSHTLRYVNV